MTDATSGYLKKPLRKYEEVRALRDGQPDILCQGDGLQQALHNHIFMASFIRQQTKKVIAGMRRDRMLVMPDEWDNAHNENWIWEARKAHSKAILDREAYKQAINERAVLRSLRLMGEEMGQERGDGE